MRARLVYGFIAGRASVFNLRVNTCVQAELLQKTAEEIQQFGVEEALCDVSCLSFESALLAGPCLGASRVAEES